MSLFGIESIRHPELTLIRCSTWINAETGEHGQDTFAQSLRLWKWPRFYVGGFALQSGHTIRTLGLQWLGHSLELSVMYCVRKEQSHG